MRHSSLGAALALAALAGAGCRAPAKSAGSREPAPAPAAPAAPAGPAEPAGPARTAAPPAELVVWQQNITGANASPNVPRSIEHAMNDFGAAPDIFILQECGQLCICGPDTTGLLEDGTCREVTEPGIASTLRALGKLEQYRFRTRGSKTIVYRGDRLTMQGHDYVWGAAAAPRPRDNMALCPTVLNGRQPQLSVMLRDDAVDPPRSILVSSSHWFISRDCAVQQLDHFENDWKTDPLLRDDDGADAGSYVDLAILGGDWNTTPTGSCLVPTYQAGGSAKKCVGVTLGDDDHVDLGEQDDLWTFCAGPVNACPEQAVKKRVDYLWARTYNDAAITHRMAVDTEPTYTADHRALRAVFTYGVD